MDKNDKYVTYREFASAIKMIHDDLSEIKNNHLPHLQVRCDRIEEETSKNRHLLLLIAFLAGINVFNIVLSMLGVIG